MSTGNLWKKKRSKVTPEVFRIIRKTGNSYVIETEERAISVMPTWRSTPVRNKQINNGRNCPKPG
jgi:hypothetical protein